MERHNQTQVFWYLPVICGGPLKVPWDHRRRLLCFDESPLSTNIYPADLFWPCLCRRGDYHNTRCPVWSSKPLTNGTCGRHDRQLLPSVIIIRQSTRQRSLVWSFRLHWSSFEYPDLVLQEVSGLIVIRDQSTKEKRERCAHNWTITKVLKIWSQCLMLDDSIASTRTPSDLWFRSRPVIIIIKLKAVHRKGIISCSWWAIGKRMNEFSKEFSGVLHSKRSQYLYLNI